MGGQSVVDYFVADRGWFQECVQDHQVSKTVINSDNSYLLLKFELKSPNEQIATGLATFPSAGALRFRMDDELTLIC